MLIKNSDKINKDVIKFWNNYLNFKELPVKWITKVISHNTGDESQNIPPSYLPEDEFFIFEHKDFWRIISVHEKHQRAVLNLINNEWYNKEKITKLFSELITYEIKIKWPVFSYYLFDDKKLIPKNDNIKELNNEDRKIYEDFILTFVDDEIKEVDMQFWDPTHKFFVLYNEKEIVSICNYSYDEQRIIGHIWIITPKKFQGKGYGKKLVNSVIHNIIQDNLIPQYRVDFDNVASNRIADSLWFEKIISSFSIIPAK